MTSDRTSLFGGMTSGDSGYHFPVTAQPGLTSPYLNFDPSYISPSSDSQYIFPEGATAQRGRFELMFATIGSSVMAGSVLGGVNGVYAGLRETRAAGLQGSVWRTQMLNFIAKRGAGTAQTLGVIALMYSGIGTILSKTRGADDELNTITAGTLTGLLYKSSAGWKRCLRSGVLGFGLSSAYCLYVSRDRLKQMLGSQ